MPNEKTTEITPGATKRNKVNTDGNLTKIGSATLAVGAVSIAAVAIVKAIKDDEGKTILKIGRFVIKWFSK